MDSLVYKVASWVRKYVHDSGLYAAWGVIDLVTPLGFTGGKASFNFNTQRAVHQQICKYLDLDLDVGVGGGGYEMACARSESSDFALHCCGINCTL